VFVTFLGTIAGVLGYVAYRYLSQAEQQQAVAQFESLADRALTEAVKIAHAQRAAVTTMAKMIAVHYGNATWPFVTIRNYEWIANSLLQVSGNHNLGLITRVEPEQLDEFETFMYDYWNTIRFPNQSVAVHSFGPGVFAMMDDEESSSSSSSSQNNNTTDNRYHDVGGNSARRYGSPYRVLFPVTHVNEGIGVHLMLNAHSQPVVGRAIDRMMACSSEEDRRQPEQDPEMTACGVLSNMQPFLRDPSRGTISRIIQPIYNAQGKLVAASTTPIIWDQIFENVFADAVSGVDCILTSTTTDENYTYTVTKGVTTARGPGDLHQTKYDNFRRSVAVTGDDGLHYYTTSASPSYVLHLYPRDEFFVSTNHAVAAMALAVGCILVTSLLFFLYDFFVQREFLAKKQLLATKRAFMRFVSHEVRTYARGPVEKHLCYK